MTAFVEAFQKQNPGIRVDVIAGGSGELLTRLQAEKANPRADLLVGPAIDLFEGYK
jgi:iron(III) transport system substrate-binding protein